MIISQKAFRIGLCLTTVGISGIFCDFFLSLKAFQQEPAYFYANELNREVANSFMFGSFPFILTAVVLSVPISVFIWVWIWDMFKEQEHHELFLLSVIAIYIFMFWSRLVAGLTWYTNTHLFHDMFKTGGFAATTLATFTLLYLSYSMTKNEKESIY